MSKLLIVESPTKAKTISKFLGSEYRVLSSFGHIRDLPKNKIGVDVEQHFTPTYLVPKDSKKHVDELKAAAKEASDIFLATDEDREGEAIAWHIAEVLGLRASNVKRITFHEITRSAIEYALQTPRELDTHLVDAQQARRILDRLVGYELSPFLWQKVRRGLSAGRVQSVAMRLIVERERERLAFNVEEFWTIDAVFQKDVSPFEAKLIERDGKKLDKFAIKTQTEAERIVQTLQAKNGRVISVKKQRVKKAPAAPFATSTLQIDANNKLGMSAKQTMVLAQQLYETGHITYMRTDSVNLAEKFLAEAQTFIQSKFGADYATGAKRYKTAKKGAQEAHEAIRPTNVEVTPESLKGSLEPRAWKLYDLIWRRTVASQLPDAVIDRIAVDIDVSAHVFRATGSSIAFDGFMKIYQATKEKFLPLLASDDDVLTKTLKPTQHFTEPPARYSDAMLVKALEEFGIGRPSTYAPTISTIIDRGYVERDESKRLFPTDIAMIVNDLLVSHFQQIVDYDFTANIERELDDIADGKLEWVPMLHAFYDPFHKNLETKLQEVKREDIMPTRKLGEYPETGMQVFLKTGRFGSYFQLGEDPEDKKADEKPKRAPLLEGMRAESVTLSDALASLAFPKSIGETDKGEEITLSIGRFGPYLKAGGQTASLRSPLHPLTITLDEAKELLRSSTELKLKQQTPIASFGKDPASNGELLVKHGRFGPYLTDGTTNVSIGKKLDPETMTREQAIELIAKKRTNPGGKRWKKKRAN